MMLKQKPSVPKQLPTRTESPTSVQRRSAINVQADIWSCLRWRCVSTSKQNGLKYCQNSSPTSVMEDTGQQLGNMGVPTPRGWE